MWRLVALIPIKMDPPCHGHDAFVRFRVPGDLAHLPRKSLLGHGLLANHLGVDVRVHGFAHD